MKLTLAHDIRLPTGVLGLAVAADGRRAFAACADGSINAVNPESGEVHAFEERHQSFASNCVLLPDGRTLISSGYDGMLIWHDTATRACWRRVRAHNFWSWRTALSPDGKRLASVTGQYLPGGWKYEPAAGDEPSVKIFDTDAGELVAEFSHTPPVLSCAFSPDGNHLAAGNLMGDVCVWNVAADQAAAGSDAPVSRWNSPDFTSWGTTKTHHYCGGIYGLAFAPDGESLLGCGMGPMVDPMAGNGKMTWQRWNWRTGEKVAEILTGEHGAGLMETLAWHPQGDSFVMAGRQAQGIWNAAVFSAADGKLAASLDTKNRITQAIFAADGTLLLVGASDGQPERKDGAWDAWGRVQVHRLSE
jgi:WD40 repeat protein